MSNWTTEEAIKLCTMLEPLCPEHGCHIALTGGALYRIGSRKDLDLLLYRIRQTAEIDLPSLFARWKQVGVYVNSGFGLVYKANHEGRSIDIFVPEEKAVIDAGLTKSSARTDYN